MTLPQTLAPFGIDPGDGPGIDACWPLLLAMADEGALVLLKLDGERGPGDTGRYTGVISGGGLGSGGGRVDRDSIQDCLAWIIETYAACWAGRVPSEIGAPVAPEVDAVWAVLDAMADEGAVVLLELRGDDGQSGAPLCSAIVSQGQLATGLERVDGPCMDECIRGMVEAYLKT